ncbi:MAG: hypothetical protein JNL29_14490 [Nitrospira sp.]|nr:hypothetical protein [Nitrospira sp.]MBS0167413.1 hypothetical protein [Nitrospira sp.]
MTARKKWMGFSGLLAVWVAMVYVNVLTVQSQQEVPLTYTSGSVARTKSANGTTDRWEVRSLKPPVRDLPVTPTRNLFAGTTVSHPQNTEARIAARKRKPPAMVAEVPATPPAPVTPPPPSPEELAKQQEALRLQQLREQMAQYRYLGYVNQNGVQKAFLGKGRELYILQEGETLDGKFQVVLIEATSVKLLDTDSKLEQTLKLKKEDSSATGA